jgi:hypothetical protein
MTGSSDGNATPIGSAADALTRYFRRRERRKR